jgi:dolichol kinase
MSSFLRWIGIVVATALLAFLCTKHDHGGLKGIPVPLEDVVASIIFAAIAAASIKYGLKRTAAMVAAPFVGGIAGVFASGDQFYGPFGGLVGLLVGTIIVLVPSLHIRRPTNRST